jgi:hypothetical protein
MEDKDCGVTTSEEEMNVIDVVESGVEEDVLSTPTSNIAEERNGPDHSLSEKIIVKKIKFPSNETALVSGQINGLKKNKTIRYFQDLDSVR